jgi:hypothetical protein
MLVSFVLLAACGSDGPTGAFGPTIAMPGDLIDGGEASWDSTYAREAHGLFIPSGVAWGAAGLAGFTCQMSYDAGSIDTDLDLFDGFETLHDGITTDLGNWILVGDDDQVTLVDFPSGDRLGTYDAPGLVVARMSHAGAVALVSGEGCALIAPDRAGVPSIAVDDGFCSADTAMALELDTDAVWLANASAGVVRIGDGRVSHLSVPGDVLAWDADLGLLFLSTIGDTTVHAVNPAGELAWSVDVGEPVAGLAAVAGAGVMVSAGDGASSTLLRVDAAGMAQPAQTAQRVSGPLVSAADGHAIALIGTGRTDFFSLADPDGEP